MEQKENTCPFCDSKELDFDGFELVEASRGYFNCECCDCGKNFKVWYTLKFEKMTN